MSLHVGGGKPRPLIACEAYDSVRRAEMWMADHERLQGAGSKMLCTAKDLGCAVACAGGIRCATWGRAVSCAPSCVLRSPWAFKPCRVHL